MFFLQPFENLRFISSCHSFTQFTYPRTPHLKPASALWVMHRFFCCICSRRRWSMPCIHSLTHPLPTHFRVFQRKNVLRVLWTYHEIFSLRIVWTYHEFSFLRIVWAYHEFFCRRFSDDFVLLCARGIIKWSGLFLKDKGPGRVGICRARCERCAGLIQVIMGCFK